MLRANPRTRKRLRKPKPKRRAAQPPVRRKQRPVRVERLPTGSELVKFYGPRAAKAAGGLLTKGLMTLVRGFGDYQVNGNTLMNGNDPPIIQNTVNQNGVVISHREYIGDINATTAFTRQDFVINPGLAETFPWLSDVAPSFESYELQGMLFEFKSLASDSVLSSATSSALGAVIMSTQYDVLDVPFTNKSQMENYQYSSSSKPSRSFIHPIECKRSNSVFTKLFVRNAGVSPGADLRLYDFGRFSIATVGMQSATGVVGELWVTYQFRLITAKLSPEIAGIVDHFHLTAATITNATPWSITPTLDPSSTLGGTIDPTTFLKYTFPPAAQYGAYLMIYQVTGASTAVTSPTFTVGTSYNLFKNNTVGFLTNGGSTTTNYLHIIVFNVDAAHSTCTISAGGTLPTSPTSGDLLFIQIPPGLTAAVNALVGLQTDDSDFSEDSDSHGEEKLMMMIQHYLKTKST